MTIKVSMKVNGKPVSADVEARTLLVTYIREHLRLTGTHVGCDTAQCGACTVLMNGRAIKSCSIVAMQAEGADLMTIEEHKRSLQGLKISYIGDGFNIAHSLLFAAGKLGLELHIATPKGYEPKESFLAHLREDMPDLDLKVTNDPREAVRGAIAVYTDVWTSMGQEKEANRRRKDFAAYQVDARLMAAAPDGAFFMHCLPAHRGEEVTDEVIDGPQSVVVQQASNRLHVQKGVLAWILGAAQR